MAQHIDHQKQRKNRERRHQDLTDALNTLLYTEHYNKNRRQAEDEEIDQRLPRICRERREKLRRSLRIRRLAQQLAVALEERDDVAHHPAADDAVVWNDDDRNNQTNEAEPLKLFVERCERADDALARLAPYRNLKHKQAEAERDRQQHIAKQEHPSAVLCGEIGETPKIAESDRGPRRCQNKAYFGCEPSPLVVTPDVCAGSKPLSRRLRRRRLRRRELLLFFCHFSLLSRVLHAQQDNCNENALPCQPFQPCRRHTKNAAAARFAPLLPGPKITLPKFIAAKSLHFALRRVIICLARGGIAQLVERLNGIQEVRGSTPLISTKLELSEHHYYRRVGSGSFFIAAERIGLPYKSQANQFVLIAPQSIYGDYLLKKQTTFLMSTTATEHTLFVYHSK